jgi:transcriptional regulator with XRE-family HTH domain
MRTRSTTWSVRGSGQPGLSCHHQNRMTDGEDQDFTSHRPVRRQPFAHAAHYARNEQKLGEAFGLTFQQVQKYEKGTNRMGASHLQEAARILDVPVLYFFEGADDGSYKPDGSTPSHAYINESACAERE